MVRAERREGKAHVVNSKAKQTQRLKRKERRKKKQQGEKRKEKKRGRQGWGVSTKKSF